VDHLVKGELLIKQDNVLNGVQLLRNSLNESRRTPFGLRLTQMLGALAEGLTTVSAATEGLEVIDEALRLSEPEDELWNVAEFLRIKGGLALLQDHSKAATSAEASRFPDVIAGERLFIWPRKDKRSSHFT
jgi:hypothetical protein